MPEIKDLKDTHKGERCFIIGNGPSLSKYDLTKLINEQVFVCNEFHVHPVWKDLKHVWYSYLSGESFVMGSFNRWKFRHLMKNKDTKFIFSKKFEYVYKSFNKFPQDRCYYININHKINVMDGHYEWDISKYSVWANTTVIESSLALAQYMGFKDIYLLGCDTTGYDNQTKQHFYANEKLPKVYLYYEPDKNDDKYMLQSWHNISKIYKNTNINIYNASKEGVLDMFRRVNYEEIV